MISESNIIDRNVATSLKNQGLAQSLGPSALLKKPGRSLSYSQCGFIFNSIIFLSRSLNRMRIDHAVAGQSAIDLTAASAATGTSIELVMSSDSYDHFLNVCIHQRIKPIPGHDRMFWDHRTGCTLKIYLSGEQIASGLGTITVPPLHTLFVNGDGIKSWIVEAKGGVGSDSRSRNVVSPRRCDKKAIVAA